MRVSLSWVRRLLAVDDLGISASELMDMLSRRVAEIDDLLLVGGHLDGVVVGRVLSCEQHPNADRLRCCTVDVGGDEALPIVCGAPNVAAGQLVAVATIGTTLRMPDKDGNPSEITIKKGKLRGEASHGMICAADELGLGDDHSGIMVLDGDWPLGTPLATALGLADAVFEVDNHNINHRPDLWGHIGWAREIAACLNLPFNDPLDSHWQDQDCGWAVDIRSPACGTYCGALISGVRNIPSPPWMVRLLEAVGSRSRGLLVDITNVVMLEVGEPMHAFDQGRISDQRIIVREAVADEPLTTLDGRTHALQAGDLLIADSNGPLALAGIMGGADSMVNEETATVVLEAAVFAPERIRGTRLRLGAGTDSSSRFEKGLPPEAAAAAINRAITLLREVLPECQVQGRFHAGSVAAERPLLRPRTDLVRRLGGVELPIQQQQDLLARLGINGSFTDGFQVPWWRNKDLRIAEDLVEEVLRLHGYEHLIEEAPKMAVQVPQVLTERSAGSSIRRHLAAAGWDEVQTYVFTDPKWIEPLAWAPEEVVHLVNAPTAEQSVMRRSLIPTLVEAVARNRRFLPTVHCYELGRVYGQGIGCDPLRDEEAVLGGACCLGPVSDKAGKEAASPFYAARDAALTALHALGHQATVAPLADGETVAGSIAGRSAAIRVGSTTVGWVGEVTAALRRVADCADRVAVFEIRLGHLLATLSQPPPRQFSPPGRFQQVVREFTWVCPETVTYGDIAQAMSRAAGPLGQGVELVTVYRGDPIPADHKALSMRITLASSERTLSDNDLAKAHQAVVTAVEKRTPARLRGG